MGTLRMRKECIAEEEMMEETRYIYETPEISLLMLD